MRLVELGPDDLSEVDLFVGLRRASNAVEMPWAAPVTTFRQRMEMRHGWDGEPERYFLAVVGDQVVGSMNVYASEYDNPEVAWTEFRIDPALRRRGHGRALLEQVEDLARGIGRPLVIVTAPATAGADAFAAAHGYPLRSVGVHRIQQLDGTAAERERFEALRAEAQEVSTTYDLVRIEGPTPPEYLDGLIRVTEAINDSPMDDLEYSDEVYDIARIKAYEEVQAVTGYRIRRILAVERSTGAVVGHTVVVVDSDQPEYGEQHDTTVVPEHRGHALGLRLKSDMLCWLAEAEPGLRQIRTGNAESNSPMIGINERLGYRVAGRVHLFQRRV